MGVQVSKTKQTAVFSDIETDDLGALMQEMVKEDPSIRLPLLALLDALTISVL